MSLHLQKVSAIKIVSAENLDNEEIFASVEFALSLLRPPREQSIWLDPFAPGDQSATSTQNNNIWRNRCFHESW